MASSKWSSYLQQTLAGVESRLDTILVGDEPQRPSPPAAKPAPGNLNSSKPENGQLRSSSSSTSTNDRLQERLARALAAKNYTAQKSDSQASSNVPSRVATPAPTTESSSEVPVVHQNDDQFTNANKTVEENSPDISADVVEQNEKRPAQVLEESPRPSTESISSSPLRRSVESPRQSTDGKTHTPDGVMEGSVHEITTSIKSDPERASLERQQRTDMETSEVQRQEEIHGYIERIDALQAKLQYLARESADSARKAASAALPNGVDKKLAEKDEQIALLMDEGQKLSKTELKHMTVIKNLRSKAAENDRELFEAKKRTEKLEMEKLNFVDRLKRVEAVERQSNQRQKLILQIQKEVEVLTADRNAKNANITELKAQLAESTSQAKANEAKVAYDLLEREKKRVAELESDLSSLKIEKELAAGRAKAQIDELRSKNEREAERARVAELDMRAEQQMMESRLELMRTRAEEVSTGATGDAQAKLFRQIETLQTQYAVATENWQGIEASLTSRATSLEKERDEALRREAEIRRKAREITVKSKHIEDELEDKRMKMDIFQQELAGHKAQLDKLQTRADDAEARLVEAKRAFDEEKQMWKTNIQRRIDEERIKWREDSAGQSPFGHGGADSPMTTSHRALTAEFLGLQNLQTRRGSSRSFTNETPITERHISRKSSAQLLRSSGCATPQRQDSAQSMATDGDTMETPSIHAMDHEDYFENVLSPSSPHNNMHDVLSMSTSAAGPSVQLVERMSAAVRRLESEKVSTKEELARLSTQRDEARAQIVILMEDVEAKKYLSNRLKDLEEENERINARYQTTLEMLGEKSELVEELRADVQDVKDMYRELVERTVK